MWLGEQIRSGGGPVSAQAEVGQVSLGGASLAVVTQGERRQLSMAMPGGFRWRPKLGQKVLVLNTSEGEAVVIGVLSGEGEALGAGELELHSPGCSIRLNNGKVEINGSLTVNGEEYKPCSCTGVI